MEAGGDKPKKKHKTAAAGVKAKKKKDKRVGKVERHNPKAHTFSGGVRSVERRVRVTLEKQARKEHAPKVDKTPDVPPPFIVVVHGPPGVGKTTLIHSLVKHYARQSVLKLNGPITLVSGRNRRLTIIECPQEMSAMLDLAKVADLALLMVDASYGFELETFEFINILQVHGFPKVIGVLTHLDKFKDNKRLRKTKRTMKNRFWSELFDGAKLFYLSGLQYGRYHRIEVQNLARFIAVQKSSILSWRQNHPYMLGLRYEDQTDPTAMEEAPRTMDVFGYVYGSRLREGTQVHLAGAGDFRIAAVKRLTDPCPPPADVETERAKAKAESLRDGRGVKPRKQNALRTLAERHRIVYAPYADIGSITVDSTSMYIQIPEHVAGFTQREGEEQDGKELPEAVRLVRQLQKGDAALDRAVANRQTMRLVKNARMLLPSEDTAEQPPEDVRVRRRAPDADADLQTENHETEIEGQEEEDMDEEEIAEESADHNIGLGTNYVNNEGHRQRVLERARQRFEQAPKLEVVIYGEKPNLKRVDKKGSNQVSAFKGIKPTDHAAVSLFEDEAEEDAVGFLGADTGTDGSAGGLLGNLGEIDGLDSLRMPVLPGEPEAWTDSRKEALRERKFITGGWSSAEEEEEQEQPKAKGGEAAGQDDIGATSNNGEEAAKEAASERVPASSTDTFLDGAPIASFVRVRLEGVPAAFVAEMRHDRPVLLGGLLPGEAMLGMVQVRLKRHRWHPKLLKTGDALLLSVGWRRFQTVPTFSLEDRGEKRMRYLKYTLEHAHCTMTAYCHMLPPNTGVLAFRSWDKVGHFRVCSTGSVLESAPSFQIMKKLKLVGEPYKIFRNTAFVKNMFNSDLEVAKYMHTKIQTVSSIRGEIKKAEGTKGFFRATFEDRILMSDLVICKCWVHVEPKMFYHPVVDVARWRPARLIGELRAAAGELVPDRQDSHYGKQLVRPERKFNPLKIPVKLDMALPFSSRQKFLNKRRKDPLHEKAAIVLSEREEAVKSLIKRLHTVQKEKRRIRRVANEKKKAVKEKSEQFIQEKRDAHKKEAKKKRYIEQGRKEGFRRKAMNFE